MRSDSRYNTFGFELLDSHQELTDERDDAEPNTPSPTLSWYQTLTQYLTLGIHPGRYLSLLLCCAKPAKQTGTLTSRYKRTALIHEFWTGFTFVSESLWPLTMLGLLTYDSVNYVNYPHLRYAATPLGLLTGFTHNYNYQHSGLLANLGADVVSHDSFLPIVGILSCATFAGLIKIVSAMRWKFRSEARLELQDSVEENHSTLTTLSSTQLRSMLLWNVALPQAEQNALLRELHQRAQHSLSAIAHLATIAFYSSHDPLKTAMIERLTQLKNQGGAKGRYAQFKLWQLGHADSIVQQVFGHSTFTTLRWLAKYHLWRLSITQLIAWISYTIEKKQCEDAQQAFLWSAMKGNYQCVACVDYADVAAANTPQGCVTQLLSAPREPAFLLAEITRLTHISSISAGDFSAQPWASWPAQNIAVFFQTIQTLLTGSEILDFSQATFTPPFANTTTQLLAHAITRARASRLNFANLNLGASGWTILAPTLSSAVEIKASATAMDDTGALVLAENLGTALESIDLSNNLITGDSFNRLLPRLAACTRVSLSQNPLSPTAVDTLSFYLGHNSWRNVDLSGVDLGAANVTALGTGFASYARDTLVLANTQLDDDALGGLTPYLLPHGPTQLDLSSNPFSSVGATSFLTQCATTPLRIVMLENTALDDDAILVFNASHIDSLSLRNNDELTEASLVALANTFTSPAIQMLRLGGDTFSPRSINQFLATLATRNQTVAQLDLTDVIYTEETCLSSIPWIKLLAPKQLFMGKRHLTACALHFSQLMPGLEDLHLPDAVLTDDVIAPFITQLPGSPLRLLNLRGNKGITSSSLRLLATQLLPESIRDNPYEVDKARAYFTVTPLSQLRELDCRETGIDASGLAAICEIYPATQLRTIWVDPEVGESGIAGCPAQFNHDTGLLTLLPKRTTFSSRKLLSIDTIAENESLTTTFNSTAFALAQSIFLSASLIVAMQLVISILQYGLQKSLGDTTLRHSLNLILQGSPILISLMLQPLSKLFFSLSLNLGVTVIANKLATPATVNRINQYVPLLSFALTHYFFSSLSISALLALSLTTIASHSLAMVGLNALKRFGLFQQTVSSIPINLAAMEVNTGNVARMSPFFGRNPGFFSP